MVRHSSTRARTAGKFGSMCKVSFVAIATFALVACQSQSQFQTPSDLLFAPTFSKTRQNLPYTRNTPYDCRTFTGSGWKGIASGTVYDFSDRYQTSQAGCFKTQQQCLAWLSAMRSFIDVPRFIRCNPYSA